MAERNYEIWEREPAPNRGHDWGVVKAGGVPCDEDWEQWSTPIGNGYMGANLFGGHDTERIQITDKTLYNEGIYNQRGGLTSFAELHLDFNHQGARDYRRALCLGEAIATVAYECDGVRFAREAFMSYPDKVMVLRLTADREGALSFVVRADVPYLDQDAQRTGRVTAEGDLLTLAGTMAHFNIHYECQVKVLHEGGTVEAGRDGITVAGADSVTLLVATGTNYRLRPELFLNPALEKLDPNVFPHADVASLITRAQAKGFDALRRDHLTDYQHLFGRVAIDLNAQVSSEPTSVLLEKYKSGETNTWLDELMFQFGRYLLIASSRQNTLPSNLQGIWSQYCLTPWTGGYWHNINVQMNYWGACSANLPETFSAYIDYFKAYYPKATEFADAYVRKSNPAAASSEPGGNGWILGTGANAYNIVPTGGHSGPGTGGFTAKLLSEYYHFTQDKTFLEDVAYPALLSLSRFFSKALVPDADGRLLVSPSASPEQRAVEEQIAGMPGHILESGHYVTEGCTFDQGFVWETYNDTLILAGILGKNDAFLDTIRQQITRLDPILIGTSGQIKEFREEQAYSDIGDPRHRHISHLCPLYPGTLINSNGEWEQAAEITLDLRGNKTTGWALAHRMNCLARLRRGEKAYAAYQRLLCERTAPNLWTLHPPFQIDANLGAMAGVAEMLLQSHRGCIEILPALPQAWKNGSVAGLVVRGNFVVSVAWQEGKVRAISIAARSGGECRLACPGIENAKVTDNSDNAVQTRSEQPGRLSFDADKNDTYSLTLN